MISPDGRNAAAAEHCSHSRHPAALAGRRGGRRGEGRMTGVAAGAMADVLRVGYPVVYSAEIAGNALPGGPQIRFFSLLFLLRRKGLYGALVSRRPRRLRVYFIVFGDKK